MVTRQQWYRWHPIRVMLVLLMLVLSALVGRGAQAASTCSVTYTNVNQWDIGFQASVDIKNAGSAPINGWTLAFTFPATQRVTSGWNATWTQAAGSAGVTATNLDYNKTIGGASSVDLGFNGSWAGSNPPPTNFTLNNTNCSTG